MAPSPHGSMATSFAPHRPCSSTPAGRRTTGSTASACSSRSASIPSGRVRFRQRLLGSEVARHIGEGRDDTPHFGTPMRRAFFDRLLSPIPRANDNTNVNCKPYGDRLVAMTETSAQHDIDCTTLRSRGRLRYEDAFGDSLFMLAHPHADFARGLVVNVATDYSMRSGLVLYEHPMGNLERRVVARVGTARIPYLHSFGLTAKHAVLLGGPFVVRPWTMLLVRSRLRRSLPLASWARHR